MMHLRTKKYPAGAAPGIFAALFLLGCATGPATIDWNRAVVPKGSKMVVLVHGDDRSSRGALAIEEVILRLGLRVVDRATLQEILKEQKLGTTGMIRAEDAKAIGKLSGADYIFACFMSTNYYCTFRLVDVKSGEVLGVGRSSFSVLDGPHFMKRDIIPLFQ